MKHPAAGTSANAT